MSTSSGKPLKYKKKWFRTAKELEGKRKDKGTKRESS